MHVPLSKEEDQLIFGKVYVDVSKWHHVEGQIPTGVLKSRGKHYRQISNITKSHLIPKHKYFLSHLAVVFAQSIEAMC